MLLNFMSNFFVLFTCRFCTIRKVFCPSYRTVRYLLLEETYRHSGKGPSREGMHATRSMTRSMAKSSAYGYLAVLVCSV